MFDDTNVYVSARLWESAPPSQWVANEMRRDTAQLRENDNFGAFFDTFYDRRNGFMFYANPLGGRAEQQFTNEGNPNADWNPVWDVRTGRFDGGWTIEMEFCGATTSGAATCRGGSVPGRSRSRACGSSAWKGASTTSSPPTKGTWRHGRIW